MARDTSERQRHGSSRVRGPRQLELTFPARWGGARAGAGRKRAPRGKVWHRARPRHTAGNPVHVTLRARLGPLRSQFVFPTVRLALLRSARRNPASFRLLHFSVQHDHIHLIVEAQDNRALSTGVQSIAIRVARYVNDLLGRRGTFWADRWHGRPLKTPREVRNALAYVLANFRKHAAAHAGAGHHAAAGIDPYSSGEWFDGWREWHPHSGTPPPLTEPRGRLGSTGVPHGNARRVNATVTTGKVVAEPSSWLAAVGWRRHGLISLAEVPGH